MKLNRHEADITLKIQEVLVIVTALQDSARKHREWMFPGTKAKDNPFFVVLRDLCGELGYPHGMEVSEVCRDLEEPK